MIKRPSPDPDEYVPLTPLDESSRHLSSPSANDLSVYQTRSIWQRLGLVSVLTLTLGSALLFGAWLCLLLLWKQSTALASGGEMTKPWTGLLSTSWATRVVTICTAVIRSAISFQASLVAAAIASIILEKLGTTILKGPFFSIVRALSVSPSQLVTAGWIPQRQLWHYAVYGLLILEVVASLVSQLMSTILIFDFTNSGITGLSNRTRVPVIWDPPMTNITWWDTPITTSWVFAEHSEMPYKGDSFDDTGHSYRALLPFASEAERKGLRTFHGIAPVIDHRVVCVNPKLSDIRLGNGPYIAGQISIDARSYPMLEEREAERNFSFACKYPWTSKSFNGSESQGFSSLCAPSTGYNWTVLMEDPIIDLFPNDTEQWGSLGYPDLSSIYLIIDHISTNKTGDPHPDNFTGSILSNDGPWTVAGNKSLSETVRITACLTNPVVENFIVNLYSDWEGQEPKFTWNRDTGSFDSESVSRQLGVWNYTESSRDRGVMELSPKWEASDHGLNATWEFGGDQQLQWHFARKFEYLPQPVSPEKVDLKLDPVLLFSGVADVENVPHETRGLAFQETLKSTESPALALQVLLTSCIQTIYYDSMMKLRVEQEANTTFATTTLIPTRWTGFSIATAIITLHLMSVGAVVILFINHTSFSMVGNCWQAIAEVVSEDTQPILRNGGGNMDKEITQWAKTESLDVTRQAQLRQRSNGRVELCTG